MSKADDLSEALGTMVETAGQAVVRVDARSRHPGSGIVWSQSGLILSASHVVRRDTNIGIGLSDGSEVSAELVGRDPSTDIALLTAGLDGLTPLAHAGLETAKVGNLVFALGRPGRTVQATMGIVSAVGSAWRSRQGGQVEQYLQTDVLMYPGFSGGPLVSAGGLLLGMNSSALLHGVSVALPVATLERVAADLQQHGRVRRGYLGVSTQIVKLQNAVRETLDQKRGLLVIAVEEGSPAAEGGLTIGDTIVKIGATSTTKHEDLIAELAQANFEEKTPVVIVRGGEIQTLNVKLGERA